MNRDRTVAIVEYQPGSLVGVSFPDFPGAGSTGSTCDEALDRAKENLAVHVQALKDTGAEFPRLRSLTDIRSDADHAALLADLGPDTTVVYALFDVDLPSKVVRVNVTFDDRLLERIDRAAKAAGESRSAFLAAAARMRLAG